MKNLTMLIVVLLLVFGGSSVQAGHSSKHHTPMQRFLYAVNDERLDHGLNALRPSKQLNKLAEDWADELCHSRALRHASNIYAPPWDIVGENVGRQGTGSINDLIRAFEQSPSHHQNILDSRYTHMGFGQCKDMNGQRWVVYRFAG